MDLLPATPRTGKGVPNVRSVRPELPKLLLALLIVLAAGLVLALHLQSVLADPKLGDLLLTPGLRAQIASRMGRDLTLLNLSRLCTLSALALWLFASGASSLATRTPLSLMLWRSGVRFLWFGGFASFEVLWWIGAVLDAGAAELWFARTPHLLTSFHTIACGGFLAGTLCLFVPPGVSARWRQALAHPGWAWAVALAFGVAFSLLSVLQYRALMVPHGDTAMYEEHLWNLIHGKGLRSQLDGGRSFLGEHLELIHVLLLPVYLIWPCLPTLNLCLSLGLGAGAIAVRGMTQRITGSGAAANWMALAYVLYFPLQYLNLEASLKTFRPENLGVPLLLFALWCLEAGRLRAMLMLIGLMLLAKEDYAIPAAMVGLYLVLRSDASPAWRTRLMGLGLCLFSVVYLWFVLAVFIPYFRGGPPHYTDYFRELGSTPVEIVLNMVRDPAGVLRRLATYGNMLFVLSLLVPLGMLPLAGPSRLWVLIPSLATILLSRLEATHSPLFHFHAPLVPVIFWAAAEGIARASRFWKSRPPLGDMVESAGANSELAVAPLPPRIACFVAACALVSGFWAGKSPLALAFYNPHTGQAGYGLALYARNPRVESFERLFPLIPQDASVAATDYVRPRFTHHRECHQYGEGGLKTHVPVEAVDYIVVDLMGPFSNWEQGRRMREVVAEPERWEIVYDDVFFFMVMRAKR